MATKLVHRIVERIPGLESEIIVYERDQYRSVHFSDGPGLNQGRRHRSRPLDYTAEYLRQVMAATTAHPKPETLLCLGLGIGAIPTLARALYPSLRVDAVEIDPGMITAAKRHFGLKTDENMVIHVEDARSFVKSNGIEGRYDIVVVDCYDGAGISHGCEDLAFYGSVLESLAVDGVLISNLVAGRAGAVRAIKSMRAVARHPWALGTPTKTNWTLVGTREHILDMNEMNERAHHLDALRRLPWSLQDGLSRCHPGWELVSVFESYGSLKSPI